MEEFLDICRQATCDDVCLMEGFKCGLDEDLRFVMPRGDLCWILGSYITFVLWTNGSAFTVGKAEDDNSLVQPHLIDVVQTDPEHSPPTPLTTETAHLIQKLRLLMMQHLRSRSSGDRKSHREHLRQLGLRKPSGEN